MGAFAMLTLETEPGTDNPEAFGEIPGGGYTAERDETGQFWTIRDVPFFSELPAGVRSNEKAISREWMESVIARHHKLETEQKHLPPVHANHHDSGRENFRIGFLRPTRVGKLILDGEPRWTLFGDIVRIDDKNFQDIRELRYPYRSAEIGRGWTAEIASLALSEDEAPHFKLPMLTIGNETRHFDREFSPSLRPAVAFSEVGESAYICFSFKGSVMAKETDQLNQDGNDGSDGGGDGGEMPPKEDKLVKKLNKVITDFQEGLPALLASFLQGLLPPTDRTDEGETQVEPAMLRERIAALLAKKEEKPEDLDKLSAMRGEIDGLKEKDRQREENAAADGLAQITIESLRAEGWHLTEDVQTAIRGIACESKTALDAYVTSYKATIPKEPPQTLDKAIFTEDAPELGKYKTMSPEDLEVARDLSRQFDQLTETGAKLSSSREEFIDINMNAMTV